MDRSTLCGAAVPGTLFLLTGLHKGEVGFTAEVHETEPATGDAEDVVEASFRAEDPARLVTWGGSDWWELDQAFSRAGLDTVGWIAAGLRALESGRHDNARQQAMAFPAIFAAAEDDPLKALGQTLSAAAVTFDDERAALFAEARTELARLTAGR